MTPLVVFALVAVMQATPASQTTLGTVTLGQAVQADGKPLAAGTYRVRVAAEPPTPVVGLSPDGSRWVEFLSGDTVVGREMASVVAAEDLPKVVDSGTAAPPPVRVQELKSGEYVRIWLTHDTKHYLVHLTVSR
jgi:hypothetical protein